MQGNAAELKNKPLSYHNVTKIVQLLSLFSLFRDVEVDVVVVVVVVVLVL